MTDVSNQSSGSSLSDTSVGSRVSDEGAVFNPVSRTITISRNLIVRYGPYFFNGVLDYRTDRLEGLQTALQKVGAKPYFERANHINEVRIWHHELLIFTCRITDLTVGGDGITDSLCKRAARTFDRTIQKIIHNVSQRFFVQFDDEDEVGHVPPQPVCPDDELPVSYPLKNALTPWT